VAVRPMGSAHDRGSWELTICDLRKDVDIEYVPSSGIIISIFLSILAAAFFKSNRH